MKAPEIILTEDGSHSLKVYGINEHYHSTFGALAESRHVFIDAGLKMLLPKSSSGISILEIGFGTGLNALLSLSESINYGRRIEYTSVEPFPLEKDIWGKLNYPDLLDDKRAGEWFEKMHTGEWNKELEIDKDFYLSKMCCSLQDYNADGRKFDLIYFDAFGPDIQPELWTEEIFEKISDMTATGGILVTYSAKGSVRRALQSAGFSVERIPGPRGKREMIRGVGC